MPPVSVKRGAYLSEDGVYRYVLWRSWWDEDRRATKPMQRRLLWIGLNPSTADAYTEDPSVRKMMHFSDKFGYDGMNLINLFAFRATLPKTMKKADFPVGPNNYDVLRSAWRSPSATDQWSSRPGASTGTARRRRRRSRIWRGSYLSRYMPCA